MHQINSTKLTIEGLKTLLSNKEEIALSKEVEENIVKCRKYLDQKMQESGTKYYGINTGFGSLCNVEVSNNEISELQHNLVMSHACGVGEEVPQGIVRIMLFLKIQSLSYGHSGVALSTVERLVYFFNNDILPVVHDTGSLGASGDLAPLAHLALPLIGLGEVYYKGQKQSTKKVLSGLGLEALALQSKEGLALLNGTQFMSAYGCYLIIESETLFNKMDLIASMSLDGYDCRMEPFNELVHLARPHAGQLATAKAVRDNLKGSEIASQQKEQVQDPYSFRCIPQVHGASKDVLSHVRSVFTTEINSVTDNPNVFPNEDEIISAGNFHGQPLAMALDYLKLALAEMGNISERRVYTMLSGTRGLPTYLTPHSGLHSGLMIPQYTAASIVSKNKQLCTPASADSIPSSNGQEDHVSMGANGAVQCKQILDNVKQLAAIELLNAAQALVYRAPLKSSDLVMNTLEAYRKIVPQLNNDRVLANDMKASVSFLETMAI